VPAEKCVESVLFVSLSALILSGISSLKDDAISQMKLNQVEGKLKKSSSPALPTPT